MIYDCFTFFNELDLLEIRLNTLDKVVDKFVLVESIYTFQNNNKELFFDNNKSRFLKFKDKIIHIVVEELPDNLTGDYYDSWKIEYYQRNAISIGLKSAKLNDVIIISDLDEIPKPELILKYANKSNICFFLLDTYIYYLNLKEFRSINLKYYFRWFLVLILNEKLI